ncbi:hypothetical protein [Nitrosomonas sp. Nm34]|uniref:hypothetical protein n=1 Tax=Nitrosomonas sp. Nm34 TaxID=1881055 RepID=UPI0008DEAD67|nr:hypothetical protein [Nitrosomonas sp. Nm34]SFI33989.1 hypothetical protein SAMN05428978_100634 [Nitrosomonas sp. Nm34]
MKTSTKIDMPIKLLSGMLLSFVLAAPMIVEAGRGHHHHHGHHHNHGHHHHHGHHRHHHHYNPPNIYYNQSYYPPAPVYYSPAPVYYPPAPVYGVGPGHLFMGITTGNAGFMFGY